MTLPSRRTAAVLALAYLAVVFGLDYLSTEHGLDAATAAVTVLTFPSAVVTTVAFLLGAVTLGLDDQTPGPDTYAPSVHAVAGIVQVALVWLALRRLNSGRPALSGGTRR
ncbi:hypothetical protein AB0M32_24325 [Streptomyces sp. NPDC051985]|uniref:hypothetical protein n=1 Tax=Streptomyces sp. NPDC051985 TaxID=3155807 RepID=UPI00341F5801